MKSLRKLQRKKILINKNAEIKKLKWLSKKGSVWQRQVFQEDIKRIVSFLILSLCVPYSILGLFKKTEDICLKMQFFFFFAKH